MYAIRSYYGRLALRHDTADRRLTPIAMRVGLASKEREERFRRKVEGMDAVRELLRARRVSQADAARDAAFAPHVGEDLARALADPRIAELDVEAIEPGATAFPREWVEGA